MKRMALIRPAHGDGASPPRSSATCFLLVRER